MPHSPIKNDFFGLCIPLAYYFRMLPDSLENGKIPLLSRCYTLLIYLPALFGHLCEIFKLYQLFVDEHFIFDEIMRNYIITSYHFTALMKCVFLRSELGGRMFRTIVQYEENIYGSGNQDIISTYNVTLGVVRSLKKFYLAGAIVMVFSYIAAPKLRDPYYIQKGNETFEVPQMPLSSWTPVEDNYWFAYAWTSLTGLYLSIFFVTTDLTCFSLILFGICQVKILEHYITNFHRYSEETRRKYGYLNRVGSYRELQRTCIAMHQEIISYVKDLNGGLKTIMVLDFLPCSIQLAGLIHQVLSNFSLIQFTLLGEFISILIARTFIYCLSAHTLALESESIAHAWYDIDWTELPRDVRTNIAFCIARSQKPLQITIGNFGGISTTTFLTIMKGTYSYMMFLTTI